MTGLTPDSNSRAEHLPSVSPIPNSKFRIPHSAARRRASSLITTLLVLVVLSTIVVAFMQSMSIERSVARSARNQAQSQLAAEAGIAMAIQQLKGLIASNPYHAIGFTNVAGQVYTILQGAPNFPSGGNLTTHYLLSGSNSTSPPSALDSTNSVAVNVRSNPSDTSGWMGSPINNGVVVYRECRAPWIYILQNPALPHQPNPSNPNYNPYIARFAYWVEDETSKIDFRIAGNANGPSGGFQRSTNVSTPSDVDLGSLPILSNASVPTNNPTLNEVLVRFRNSTTSSPVDAKVLGQATNIANNIDQASRFYTTFGSYANDLSGSGQRRVNLNALVTEGVASNTIASDLDDIAYAITGNHIFSSLNNTSDQGYFHDLPDTNGPIRSFGSRFYPGIAQSDTNRAVYLKKIAANIRDYIDADSQPTFVGSDGNVATGIPPNWWNNWPPQALGKEAVPYLQETAWTGVEVSALPNGATRTMTIEIDHYLEFFNPSTKAFTAPQGTRISISNLPAWSAGAFPALEPLDFDIDISGVSFPAGRVTVITTNPGPPSSGDPPGLILDSSTLVRRSLMTEEGVRRFTSRTTNEKIGSSTNNVFRMFGRSSSISDTEARLIIAGPNGVIDALPKYGFTAASATPWNFGGTNVGSRTRFVYAAGLRGNDNNGRSGDPRSLSEQLQLQVFNSGNADNTRFYGTVQGNAIPGSSTLGRAGSTFVDPSKALGTGGAWGDFNPTFDDTAATAYAVVRDEPMVSIGELGHIYDPHRLPTTVSIQAARGGGRTLKVGQLDDVVGNATRFTSSWENAAWRLTEVFGVSSNRTQVELPATTRGKVNVNSVIRDGGVALQALLRQFVFLPSPAGGPSISGRQLTAAEMSALTLSISNYITANGLIVERGEISQIPFFSGFSTNTNTLAGSAFPSILDRGREEIFRRTIELVNTRSASFSVYAVGEAVRETPQGRVIPLSRAKAGRVFMLEPNFGGGARSRATGYSVNQLYHVP